VVTATQCYRQFMKDLVDAKDFAEQVKGFDEGKDAKLAVTLLSIECNPQCT